MHDETLGPMLSNTRFFPRFAFCLVVARPGIGQVGLPTLILGSRLAQACSRLRFTSSTKSPHVCAIHDTRNSEMHGKSLGSWYIDRGSPLDGT